LSSGTTELTTVFSGDRNTTSLVFCVVFSRLLFVLNSNLLNATQKTRDGVLRSPLKTEMRSGVPEDKQ
jgi:hypothetical protein